MTVGTIEKRGRRTAPPPAAPVAVSRGWIWAVIQLAVLGAEILGTLFLLAQPTFRPQDLQIGGTRHVSPAEVKAALELPADRNIFFLNHADLEHRLQAIPWVRSAAVTLALPDRVSVQVHEWTPSAVLQVGESSYYVSGAGRVLDPATEAGSYPVINRPDLQAPHSGQQVIAGELLPMLLQLRAGFRPAFKVTITSFTIDRRDVLSAQTDRGWSIIFGQMLTAEDRSTLETKVASLRALSTRLDLTSRQIVYVNLENPGSPAVQMRGKK